MLEKPTVAVSVAVCAQTPHTPLGLAPPLGEGTQPCFASKEEHAMKLAIEECGKSEGHYREMADQLLKARETLQEFRKTTPFRVIVGGTAEAIRLRWPAVEG